jgi:hypothetical protein
MFQRRTPYIKIGIMMFPTLSELEFMGLGLKFLLDLGDCESCGAGIRLIKW